VVGKGLYYHQFVDVLVIQMSLDVLS
jgi:hypothetical protein